MTPDAHHGHDHGDHPHAPGPQAVTGWQVVERAAEMARRGEHFALATVVWRMGPSSGQQGSRAIVTADGQLYGWIGGACAEPLVVREAQRAIVDREARLLLLGTPEQFGGAVPDGIRVIPIACSSEGALEVFVEPVIPVPRVVVVGRSPMAHTLSEMVGALGWQSVLVDWTELGTDAAAVGPTDIVVVATQGHGDEEALEQVAQARPAYLGLVASHRRGETVLGYLADRGVSADVLERVHVPAGLDLGSTSHREIAVAILAEVVQLRAAGQLGPVSEPDPEHAHHEPAGAHAQTATDPVCGMTVTADASGRPYEHEGVTYWFCSAGCRSAFEKDPSAYVGQEARHADHQ
jgi:xanthine dehydrogenase accessory factor